jgi:hypothetical protein
MQVLAVNKSELTLHCKQIVNLTTTHILHMKVIYKSAFIQINYLLYGSVWNTLNFFSTIHIFGTMKKNKCHVIHVISTVCTLYRIEYALQ